MNTLTTASVTLRPDMGGAYIYVGSLDNTINISVSHEDQTESKKKLREVLENIRLEIDKSLQ